LEAKKKAFFVRSVDVSPAVFAAAAGKGRFRQLLVSKRRPSDAIWDTKVNNSQCPRLLQLFFKYPRAVFACII
jgi:hypothetical protein